MLANAFDCFFAVGVAIVSFVFDHFHFTLQYVHKIDQIFKIDQQSTCFLDAVYFQSPFSFD